MTLKDQIAHLKQEFSSALKKAHTQDACEEIRIAFLGRKGHIAHLMEQLKSLSLEEKREYGPLLNELKLFCEQAFQEKKDILTKKLLAQEQLKKEHFDVTAYLPHVPHGSIHPLTQLLEQIHNLFISMGFEIVDGPEIETEFYNFEALNIPQNHPARDMWDTLWLNIPNLLLRTHTSPIQIHTMEKKNPPLAIVAPGRCYRHEATDASHDFMFMQVEGFLIDKNISLSHLRAVSKEIFQALFEKQQLAIRTRPSYFPFVEPGIEIDIECPFCKQGCSTCKYSRWIETGGAGLIHPHVLTSCNIDPQIYSGFAFGFGLTRLAMLKYGIPDIRLLHAGNIKFLNQF